jgi:hypothetical protein
MCGCDLLSGYIVYFGLLQEVEGKLWDKSDLAYKPNQSGWGFNESYSKGWDRIFKSKQVCAPFDVGFRFKWPVWPADAVQLTGQAWVNSARESSGRRIVLELGAHFYPLAVCQEGSKALQERPLQWVPCRFERS